MIFGLKTNHLATLGITKQIPTFATNTKYKHDIHERKQELTVTNTKYNHAIQSRKQALTFNKYKIQTRHTKK
jgi:hypothetical protein